MERLPLGKLPIDILEKTVVKMTGAPSDRILTGPEVGVDFGVVRLDKGYMVVSSDPITGVVSRIGWYAVNVNANDVATSGNRPQFMESIILLPEGSTGHDVALVARHIHASARSLGMSVVGGHTEITPGLRRPIVVVTAFSFVKDFVTSAGAKAGDTIMMTKSAGLEGTSVIASESRRLGFPLERSLAAKATKLEGQLSVVPDAVHAYGTGVVHAMHDCTEGGVLGAVYEMSLASGLGFEITEAEIPVAAETRRISEVFRIDPIRLIGSGSLLLAVAGGGEENVRRALRRVCEVTEIGHFRRGERTLAKRDGSELQLQKAPVDELWRTLGRLGRPNLG